MTTRRTQADMLLELLRERRGAGVTPLLALEQAGSLRLAAVIFDLKKAGHTITTEMVSTGNGKRVAKYVLHERPEQLSMPL